jgi:hypothetical protein
MSQITTNAQVSTHVVAGTVLCRETHEGVMYLVLIQGSSTVVNQPPRLSVASALGHSQRC